MFTRRAAFEKNFEVEGRIDWKSKKKFSLPQMSYLYKKRSTRPRMSFFH